MNDPQSYLLTRAGRYEALTFAEAVAFLEDCRGWNQRTVRTELESSSGSSHVAARHRIWWLMASAVSVACAGALFWHLWYPGRPFDAHAWLADERDGSGVRQQMADRLIAHRVLIGKTRAEVVEMLGPPRRTTYFNDWDLVYRLGDERGFISMDSEWLLVRLDESLRVSEACIGRD